MKHERAINFYCEGASLNGILHLTQQPAKRGLLVVVGGPQYRVGSHRQFLLLARDLAAADIPVMRFDYRGMGDSEGETGQPEPCEHLSEDIRTAIDTFFMHAPGLEEVALWGLCDGATASLLYAHTDPRVTGVALLNPWVSTQANAAKAYLKHYYLQRLLNADLWKKVVRGEFDFIASVKSLYTMLGAALGFRKDRDQNTGTTVTQSQQTMSGPLQQRMLQALQSFSGRSLLVISGNNDLIAAEFMNMATSNRQWRKQLGSTRITRHDFQVADHTFSRRVWRDQVMLWTRDWLRSW